MAEKYTIGTKSSPRHKAQSLHSNCVQPNDPTMSSTDSDTFTIFTDSSALSFKGHSFPRLVMSLGAWCALCQIFVSVWSDLWINWDSENTAGCDLMLTEEGLRVRSCSTKQSSDVINQLWLVTICELNSGLIYNRLYHEGGPQSCLINHKEMINEGWNHLVMSQVPGLWAHTVLKADCELTVVTIFLLIWISDAVDNTHLDSLMSTVVTCIIILMTHFKHRCAFYGGDVKSCWILLICSSSVTTNSTRLQ